jgi:protoporphyrinogen oxidase
VRVGRVQNFGSWSPFLVKDGRTCLGLEYFVNEGDGTWTMPDDELISLATKEITELGLVTGDVVEAGLRRPSAQGLPGLRRALQAQRRRAARLAGARGAQRHPVGRNGMHRYNNADHSMLTAMLTAQNILAGERVHDIWSVNVEEDYHEEQRTPLSSSSGTGRDAPVIPRDAKRPAA